MQCMCFAGGDNNPKTSIYDPVKDSWVVAPDMNIGRGYHSSAITSESTVFTIGGSWASGIGGKNGEVCACMLTAVCYKADPNNELRPSLAKL